MKPLGYCKYPIRKLSIIDHMTDFTFLQRSKSVTFYTLTPSIHENYMPTLQLIKAFLCFTLQRTVILPKRDASYCCQQTSHQTPQSGVQLDNLQKKQQALLSDQSIRVHLNSGKLGVSDFYLKYANFLRYQCSY